MMPIKDHHNPKSEILLYTTQDGNQRIEVRLENGTVWLSQIALAELFQTTKQNISLHLKNIFDDGELETNRVVKESLTTAVDGKKYKTKFYCLEAIIAVGYRVKSLRGTQFRQWATERLQEYIVKGFVLDDERLAEQVTQLESQPESLDARILGMLKRQSLSLNIPSWTNPQADSGNTGLPQKGRPGWTDYIAQIRGRDDEEELGSEEAGGGLCGYCQQRDETVLRSHAEILDEVKALDEECAEILKTVRGVL